MAATEDVELWLWRRTSYFSFLQFPFLWTFHDLHMRAGRSGPQDVCAGQLVRGRQSGGLRIKRAHDDPVGTCRAKRTCGVIRIGVAPPKSELFSCSPRLRMEFALSVFIDVLECERRYLALNLCNNERLALVMLLSFRGRDGWSTSLTFDMHPSHTLNTMAFSPPTSCSILKAIAIALR